MSSLGWMITAFLCAGAGIGGYVSSLVVRERRLTKHLDTLRKGS
jgi:CcmD family protein